MNGRNWPGASGPFRPPDDVGPETAKAFGAAGSRAKQRGIADQQLSRERIGSRLEQGVKTRAPQLCEGMRGRRQVYALASEDFHACHAVADPFELRQVRMSIESPHTLKEAELIAYAFGGDGHGRSVRLNRRPQPKAVVDRHAKTGKKCPRKTTEALPGRNRLVSMMEMFCDLALRTCFALETRSLADVVVWANENEMIRILQESP